MTHGQMRVWSGGGVRVSVNYAGALASAFGDRDPNSRPADPDLAHHAGRRSEGKPPRRVAQERRTRLRRGPHKTNIAKLNTQLGSGARTQP